MIGKKQNLTAETSFKILRAVEGAHLMDSTNKAAIRFLFPRSTCSAKRILPHKGHKLLPIISWEMGIHKHVVWLVLRLDFSAWEISGHSQHSLMAHGDFQNANIGPSFGSHPDTTKKAESENKKKAPMAMVTHGYYIPFVHHYCVLYIVRTYYSVCF